MSDRSEATYSPVAHLPDPASVPLGLDANDELHVPLPPRRDPTRLPPGLRRLRDGHRLVLNFCYSDRLLLRWDRVVGSAEAAVARAAPHAAVTLDIPFYDFLTPAMRERALARSLGAITRALRLWECADIQTIPLIKGLGVNDWSPQLDLCAALGLRRVAYYAREQLLEHDARLVHEFVRQSRARRLRPLLFGVFTPRPVREGAYDAAASYHYILARLGRALDATGRDAPVSGFAYSGLAGTFLARGDRAALTQHNFLQTRRLFSRPPPLTRYGVELT